MRQLNKSIVLIIVVVILTISCSIPGIDLSRNEESENSDQSSSQNINEVSNSNETEDEEQIEPEPEDTGISTEDWELYEFEEVGIQFKAPSDWQYMEDESMTSMVVHMKAAVNFLVEDGGMLMFYVYDISEMDGLSFEDEFGDPHELNSWGPAVKEQFLHGDITLISQDDNFQVDNMPAIRMDWEEIGEEESWRGILVTTINSDWVYIFYPGVKSVEWEEYEDVFLTLLNTVDIVEK